MITEEQAQKRFWPNFKKTEGCWLWTGPRDGRGYGRIEIRRKNTGAHRISWLIANRSEIPNGICVCHTCDVPLCVNPDHLFLGTHTDNMRDMKSKGRGLWKPRELWNISARDPAARNGRLDDSSGTLRCKRGHDWIPENIIQNGPFNTCKPCKELREKNRSYK